MTTPENPRLSVLLSIVARQLRKVRLAEDAWNSRDPEKVARLYRWQRVAQSFGVFFRPRRNHPIPPAEWAKELDYRLIKEL
jgi:uncharacterized protein